MQFLSARFRAFVILVTFATVLSPSLVMAQPVADDTATVADRTVKLSAGGMSMVAPEGWARKKPRTNIVQHEFAIPGKEDDDAARLTIMGAGGGVEANVARWIGQFQSADGGAVKNAADPPQSEVAGQTIHWVDLSGTYAGSPRGPFGPKTNRPGYRMVSAIIATKAQGQYFVKCYGPATTVAAAEKSFREFIQTLKVQPAADPPKSDATK